MIWASYNQGDNDVDDMIWFLKNGIMDACSTVDCCPLLWIVFRCFQLLSIVFHCWPFLPSQVPRLTCLWTSF